MPRPRQEGLTLRESQIMEVVWKLDRVSVEQIQEKLSADLAGSTIRTLLRVMEEKGYVDFHKQGKAKIYHALIPKEKAQASALQHLIQRLFHGSADLLLIRLVEDEHLSMDELDHLRQQLKRRQQKEKSR